MNWNGRGLLLLCSHLGQEGVRPLSVAQLRQLRLRVTQGEVPKADPYAQIGENELCNLGYGPEESQRILSLLNREAVLDGYLLAGEKRGIFPLTRLCRDYPATLCKKRGGDGPPVLFCAGNPALLNTKFISLVGARKLSRPGVDFAKTVGKLAQQEGLTLVTGGAEGADLTGLEACLSRGGRAIVFVPDVLTSRLDLAGERCLVCSEQGYDLPFSPQRAHSRNACIHTLAEKTLVAQTGHGVGGTWSGSVENLRGGWSELYVNDDGSSGAAALCQQGATPVGELISLSGLRPSQQTLF